MQKNYLAQKKYIKTANCNGDSTKLIKKNLDIVFGDDAYSIRIIRYWKNYFIREENAPETITIKKEKD